MNEVEIIDLKSNCDRNELVIPLQKKLDKIMVVILEFNGVECEEYYEINLNNNVGLQDEFPTSISLAESLSSNGAFDIEQIGNGLATLMRMGMN